MPIIGGRVVRARYTALKLDEVSSVDNPAQPGARATICKRFDPAATAKTSWLARAVAKYVDSDDGAHTFTEVIAENKYDEEIWPFVSALSQAITSIMGDSSLSSADKQTKVTDSVDQFLAAVRAIDPPENGGDSAVEKVEKQLRELISKRANPMPKTIEDLEREVAALKGENTTLKGQVSTVEGDRDTQKARADKAETELTTEKTAHVETKKALTAATDETLKIGEREIKKSIVGEDNFAVFKAQQEEAQMGRFEKRAGDEFGHLPGTAVEKAAVLKHAEAMPEEARKTLMTVMTAAEKMATGGFSRFGHLGGGSGDVKKAKTDFTAKVDEIAKTANISKADAMSQARRDFPAEWAAAYPEQAEQQGG